MKIAAAFGLAVLMSCSAWAEDVPWQKLRDTSDRYLEACVPASDVQSMKKKLTQRVQQRLSDNDALVEDNIMRDLMLDWAFANEGRIKKREKDAVKQACLYFVLFHDKGWNMPAQIRDQMTPGNVKDILEYLDKEIAAGKGGAGEKEKDKEKDKKKKGE